MNLRRILLVPIGLVGLWGAVLGLHGLDWYFSGWRKFLMGVPPHKLFGVLDLSEGADFLSNQILWMSVEGLASWFMPTLVGLVGLGVFYWLVLDECVN